MAGLLVNLGIRRDATAVQEVEVTAFVGLRNVLTEKRAIAAREACGRRFPLGLPLRELCIAYLELELPCSDVELDEIAVLHERERAADVRLRCDVQHARAVRGAAHARIRYAH